MMLLFATIFAASLLGSLHCAGMCGAFVAFAVGASEPGAPSRMLLQAAYHGGRLAVYVMLGAVAGTLGATLDLGGAMIGVQRAAAIGAGAIMVVFGLLTLAQVAGYKVRSAAPKCLQPLLAAGHRTALALPPLPRAGAIGLLTALLPCGWLWAFVITAAGTGHPATAALAMAAFWAGTVPVLAALGAGIQKLAGRFAGRLPAIAAGAIIVVGLYTIATRLQAAAAIAAMRPASATEPAIPPCCQKGGHR